MKAAAVAGYAQAVAQRAGYAPPLAVAQVEPEFLERACRLEPRVLPGHDAVDALASQQSKQEEQDRIIEETISQSATELAEAGTGQQAQTTDGQTQGTEAQTSDAAAASAEAQTNVYLAQGYYVVEQGDKLTDISKKVYGTEDMVQQICERNNITDMDHICAGDKLMLP